MASASVTTNSACGFISLLDEDDVELKMYALRQLDALVPQFWMGEWVDGRGGRWRHDSVGRTAG